MFKLNNSTKMNNKPRDSLTNKDTKNSFTNKYNKYKI